MEAVKITNQNFRRDKKKNIHTLYVDADEHNKLVDDMEDVYPVSDVVFDGTADLSKSHTIYDYLTVSAAMEVGYKTYPMPIPGGYAEVTLVGDGATTPTFSAGMTKMPNSEDYDNTLGSINKIGIYYDGVSIFYTITVIS